MTPTRGHDRFLQSSLFTYVHVFFLVDVTFYFSLVHGLCYYGMFDIGTTACRPHRFLQLPSFYSCPYSQTFLYINFLFTAGGNKIVSQYKWIHFMIHLGIATYRHDDLWLLCSYGLTHRRFILYFPYSSQLHSALPLKSH